MFGFGRLVLVLCVWMDGNIKRKIRIKRITTFICRRLEMNCVKLHNLCVNIHIIKRKKNCISVLLHKFK